MYINIDYYRYGYNGYNINNDDKTNKKEKKIENKDKIQYYRLSPGFKEAHNTYLKHLNK